MSDMVESRSSKDNMHLSHSLCPKTSSPLCHRLSKTASGIGPYVAASKHKYSKHCAKRACELVLVSRGKLSQLVQCLFQSLRHEQQATKTESCFPQHCASAELSIPVLAISGRIRKNILKRERCKFNLRRCNTVRRVHSSCEEVQTAAKCSPIVSTMEAQCEQKFTAANLCCKIYWKKNRRTTRFWDKYDCGSTKSSRHQENTANLMHPNPVLVVLLSDVPRGVCTLEGFGEVVNFRPETRCRCGGRRSAVDPCMAGKIHWCCTVKETTQIQQESLSLQSVFNAKMQE